VFARAVDDTPGTYMFQVVVPNIAGIAALGAELISNPEYVNVSPAPTTRFEIGTESTYARQETSPGWWGSDEVGLHTIAAAFDTSTPPQLVDLHDFADPSKRPNTQDQRFKDIQKPLAASPGPESQTRSSTGSAASDHASPGPAH